MFPLATLSGKPLVSSTTNEPAAAMLAAAMNNNPLISTCNRNISGTDLGLLALMHTLKPEAQQVYRTLVEHIGSVAIDGAFTTPASRLTSTTASPSQPLPATATPTSTTVSQHPFAPSINSILKRSLSSTLSSAEARSPSHPFVPSPVLPVHPTSFAMTAAIINALSAHSTAVGMHMLPACSPLLQLAIRQALCECLSSLGPLTLQGDLEIRTGSGHGREHSTHSLTVLRFNDNLCIRRPTQDNVSPINTADSSLGSLDTASLVQGPSESWGPPCVNLANQVNPGSSRRKSMNPTKCSLNEDSDCLVPSDFNQTPSPISSASTITRPHSGPTSPSTDSGILDLSRNGSLAGSAPITPLKDQSALSEPDRQLIEAYQKQLNAFGRLQAVWNKESITYSICRGIDFTPTNAVSPTTMPVTYSGPISGALSAPSSPIKAHRRDRGLSRSDHCGGLTGRTCTLRRPNCNRRFPCNQCREEFPSLHTLEEHTMFRHGAYRCHICRAKFTQRSNLQRHALKHVGFKPFECRVCCKAYYRKDHLMRHMEMSHPGHAPRENITVHLTSSESLEYLNRSCLAQTVEDSVVHGPVDEPVDDVPMEFDSPQPPLSS